MIADLDGDLNERYLKTRALVGEDDPYLGNRTVGIHEAIDAHFLIAKFFVALGYGMSDVGPRDIDLLHSALTRQTTGWGLKRKWSKDIEVCATLFFGLIKDHPFHDANKRTAFLTCLYHLQKCGLVLTASQKEFENVAVAVANDELSKYSRFNELRRRGAEDPEVRFLAYYLKSNSRNVDKHYYVVTYRQLDSILRRFGYCLENPHGNRIDVVRIEFKRRLFRFGAKEQVGVKVARVGFRNWTSEVNQGVIKTIRKATGLVYKKGVDSETFFREAGPIDCLIAEYQEPLVRLAER